MASIGDVLTLTLQRYCEQLLSGRVAVSARDVAILMKLEREVRRDAERDRLIVARLMFTARRLVTQLGHRAWRWPTPDETASWVAELQQIAPGRADLLAEAAGVMLGAAEGTVDEPRAARLPSCAARQEPTRPWSRSCDTVVGTRTVPRRSARRHRAAPSWFRHRAMRRRSPELVTGRS